MPISKEAQRILLRAAEWVKDRAHWHDGWKDSITFSGSEKVCALGALRKATVLEGLMPENSVFNTTSDNDLFGGHPAYIEAADALARTAIPMRNEVDRHYIPTWNDQSGNTNRGHDRVHEGFCKAVKEHVEPDDSE